MELIMKMAATPRAVDVRGGHERDRIAVHLPPSIEAQVEVMRLIPPTDQIVTANGRPTSGLAQDIVMGSYDLTSDLPGERNEGMGSSRRDGICLASSRGAGGIHAMRE